LQELRATNDNPGLGYQLFYWRTRIMPLASALPTLGKAIL
jgi:hypothetical protein